MTTPLYKKIQQDIFELIVSGKLREGDRIASESEIMKQYYVSAITAKNALNALVDRELVIRVKGKGTFVAVSPFSVPVPQTKNSDVHIGILLPSMSTRIDQVYILYLDEYCRKKGYRLSLRCSCESPKLEHEMLKQFVDENVNGIILFPVVVGSNVAVINQVARKKPVIFLDRYLPNVNLSWVTADNVQGGALAAKFLMNSIGGDGAEIAAIHFPTLNNTVTDRLQGFRGELYANGVNICEDNFCLINDHNLLDKSNHERIEYILSAILDFLRRTPHIRGLFAVNAEIAQVAYYAVHQLGFIPDENFFLISFDNSFLSGVHFIKQDSRKLVETGIDLLYAAIQGNNTVVHRTIPAEFVHVQKSPTQPGNLSNLIMGPNP